LYRKSCDGGDLAACTYLGSMYVDGKLVAKDPRQAAFFYAKACEGGNETACALSNTRR
jgi:hypothetical protein